MATVMCQIRNYGEAQLELEPFPSRQGRQKRGEPGVGYLVTRHSIPSTSIQPRSLRWSPPLRPELSLLSVADQSSCWLDRATWRQSSLPTQSVLWIRHSASMYGRLYFMIKMLLAPTAPVLCLVYIATMHFVGNAFVQCFLVLFF